MFEGRKTANGDIFRQNKLTGANNFLRLGTRVRVTNIKNGKSIVVKINDRMNKRMRRLIDLSRESARRLGFIQAGLAQVRMEVIGRSSQPVLAKRKSKKKAVPKIARKKTVASKKSKPKKKKKVIVKRKSKTKKEVVVAKTNTISKKKVSRYGTKKKNYLNKRKKQALFSKINQTDLNWYNTLEYYKESYAKDSSFVEGGPLSYLDDGQALKSFLKPSPNEEYAFVLISKELQTPEEFRIEPIDSLTQKPIKGEVLVESAPTFSKKGNHYIYYFAYSVPEGTDYLRFTINGIDYSDAKSEDFALFIFTE